MVLGQHFFNRTTDVTQTFGIEKYVPYPLYSVFSPTDHDLGEAHPGPEPGGGWGRGREVLGESWAERGRVGGSGRGGVRARAGQPGLAERPGPSRRKPWTASAPGPCCDSVATAAHRGPARPPLTSGRLPAQC